jgi:hypothetical protein
VSTWEEFSAEAPQLAAVAEELFSRHRHHTMATLRADGAPRISGTEVVFADGELRIGMMPGTRREDDLRRDPRIALHSQGIDHVTPDTTWPGEAKVSGRAVDLGDGAWRIEVTEVSHVGHGGDPPDHLDITTWHEGRGVRTLQR